MVFLRVRFENGSIFDIAAKNLETAQRAAYDYSVEGMFESNLEDSMLAREAVKPDVEYWDWQSGREPKYNNPVEGVVISEAEFRARHGEKEYETAKYLIENEICRVYALPLH